MKIKRIITHTILLIIVLAAFTGCGITRKHKGGATIAKTELSPEVIAKKGGVAADFNILSFPSTITFTQKGTEMSLDGEIRMAKDSIIWISLRKFGFEAVRILMTKDSIWVLDRLGSRYFAESYRFVEQQVKQQIGFNFIEAVLLANPIIHPVAQGNFKGCSNDTCIIEYNERFSSFQSSDETSSQPIPSQINHIVSFSKKTGRILNNTFSDSRGESSLTIDYLKWRMQNDIIFPERIEINGVGGGQIIKITFNNGVMKTDNIQFPFKIPASYKLAKQL